MCEHSIRCTSRTLPVDLCYHFHFITSGCADKWQEEICMRWKCKKNTDGECILNNDPCVCMCVFVEVFLGPCFRARNVSYLWKGKNDSSSPLVSCSVTCCNTSTITEWVCIDVYSGGIYQIWDSLQNAGIVLQIGHNSFLSNSYMMIIYLIWC